METDNNCHPFAGCHSAATLTFLGAVFEQLFLPLGDKYVAKITDIAKQLNSFIHAYSFLDGSLLVERSDLGTGI
jgi:hypothetical protein